MDEVSCVACGEIFTDDELEFEELKKIRKNNRVYYICPDCYDHLNHLAPQDQITVLLTGDWGRLFEEE